MVFQAPDPITVRPGLAIRPVGAHVHDGGVVFRVWAPKHQHVRVATGDGTLTRYVVLERDEEGYFVGRDEHGRAGDTYWYQLEERLAADPAARFQITGVDGPSQVVDAMRYTWRARDWKRPPLRGRVIYELHIGTFTPEGTFAAAIDRLDYLRDLGINAIQLMPVAEFAGRRNWGYDGVMLFAPAHTYGSPDELRGLIDAAHERGIAVILDVVYNHLGPCGNMLPTYSDDYFHSERESLWGSGLNFDGPQSRPVREFFLQNACMWFDEYRVDGLRLDAVHAMHDGSTPHVIAEIAAAAHHRGGFVIAEDERNEANIITPAAEGGWGVDGMWADDFHHTMRVALTREQHAYYANYAGTLAEIADTLRAGWLYRGQHFGSWNRPRGTDAAHLPAERFVTCITNHDQVGNRPLGDRLSEAVSPEQYRAASMLLCFVPHTPMVFMGQEWAARSPFPFFCEHPGEVGATIAANRRKEFAHMGATYAEDILQRMPDPQAEATFHAAKLNWGERKQAPHAGVLALYRECLRLRHAHAIFQSPPREQWRVDTLGERGLALRWEDGDEMWVLVVAFSAGLEFTAPDRRRAWQRVLASNEGRFGGDESAPARSPGAVLWRVSATEPPAGGRSARAAESETSRGT